MQAGNIIKVTEQFNIHKEGTLGVLVSSQPCGTSKNEDSVSVILEDGHFISCSEDDPLQNVGYNSAFNKAGDEFEALLELVRDRGKDAFIKSQKCSEIGVVLTDNADRKTYFSVGFDESGKYYQSKSTYEGEEQGTHTVNAFIGEINIDIDGNAWRDIDAGDYMEDFIDSVIYGERDASEFLVNIAEALGVEGEAGVVL